MIIDQSLIALGTPLAAGGVLGFAAGYKDKT